MCSERPNTEHLDSTLFFFDILLQLLHHITLHLSIHLFICQSVLFFEAFQNKSQTPILLTCKHHSMHSINCLWFPMPTLQETSTVLIFFQYRKAYSRTSYNEKLFDIRFLPFSIMFWGFMRVVVFHQQFFIFQH